MLGLDMGPPGTDLPWSPLDDVEAIADLVQRFAVDLAAWQG